MRLNEERKSHLEELFGARVTFDETERRLYGHDIAALPGLVGRLIGDTTPDAVVQPETEDELVELVELAKRWNVPLVPRGKATSGYGGVVPVKKGLVVDFFRMKSVISIEEEGLLATVQPGISWEQLDDQLKPRGLALRLYPTSYPSSTVGGWLAQGGAGIGSYEFGYFRDNVVAARVVLPTGDVRTLSGAELDLVSDAEGTTGLISAVTLRLRALKSVDVAAVACPDARALQGLAGGLVESGLPIWSMVFINPRMAQMMNVVPLREHNGHTAEERVLLPEAHLMSLAFEAENAAQVNAALSKVVKAYGAELLSEEIARHAWDHRFKVMSVKRLGPSLVPAEVVVPLSSLGDVMAEIEARVDQPIVKEGVIVREGRNGAPEAVILGFIPSDQRKLSYNFVFGLALTVMRIAEEHGGRPYSTGLYFSSKADRILGQERTDRLRAFKEELDPGNVMNPGKVIGRNLMGGVLALAGAVEPFVRALGNRVRTVVGERPNRPVRGIPADVAWYAYSCSQCGYCVDECDQFYGRGWESQSPRGKWYWLREYMEGRADWSQRAVDTFLLCTTCEVCNLRCSEGLPVESSWLKLRGRLIGEEKRMTFPPFEMMAEALRAEGDIWAGYRKDRSAWFPGDLAGKHGPGHKSKNVYFAGCTASFVEHDIGMASVRLLDEAGVDFTYLGEKENCCATPMLVAGKWDLFAETMKRNIEAVRDAGAHTVISSCPACDMMWRQVYPAWAKKLGIDYGITAKHYSEVIAEKIGAGEFRFPDGNGSEAGNGEGGRPVTVTWHDSCHLGRASGVFEPPRELIKAIPGAELVEMAHNREDARCCGSVLTLIKDPEVAAEIGKVRLNEAIEAGADKVLALCPCCQFQLRVSADKKDMPVEVVDLARFAASALGYEFPDPNPEVQRQWAVFEGMIALMTPEGFADLMKTMWPELIDAMPFGMGRMMRLMGHVPGTLELMKPLFPVLFPILLPMMMPKVMPTMLARVAERVPMPDYMLEQMPDLMPKVMDGLMPHMIGDVVPLVTQPMIDYLRGKVK